MWPHAGGGEKSHRKVHYGLSLVATAAGAGSPRVVDEVQVRVLTLRHLSLLSLREISWISLAE